MDYGDTYFPLFRSLINHRYMRDSEKFHFWVWCLLKATHAPYKQLVGNQTVPLEVGQFIFGRQAASKETGLSEQTIRTLLKFFSSSTEQKLTIKSTNKYSIITVVKYAIYIEKARASNQQINQHLTSNQPAANHKQEGKEGKEEIDFKTFPPSDDGEGGQNDFFETKKRRKLTGKQLSRFELFWEAFDYKKGKAAAGDAWLDAKIFTDATFEKVMQGAQREAAARPEVIRRGSTPIYPQGWLSGRRWEDEDNQQPKKQVIIT